MASEDLFEAEFSEGVPNELYYDYAEDIAEKEASRVEGEAPDSANKIGSSELAEQSDKSGNGPGTGELGQEIAKLFHLPLTRIRNIMKLDPEVSVASNEAVFLVARSTEYFIESLAREAYSYTIQAKKKTIQKRDVELVISSVNSLMFLDGAMSF